ncbi:type I CRISPR-associated protein Cas7 [Spirosoma fluviale]|uniref:CRISPR-associated protein Csh2 n=1 Tax=Spirosoma fluviale TaxID=1597977 RepID=A0A286GDB7_9BACT|nr:type I CRISPR-associated protein Cas7 [Spirosoma fluviale]SOD93119.1 CRISPR-associated protein Csh2 [Spirosoma fluviale]
MGNPFFNRVFGCVIIKSVNSNYNADFSHQPRTLPDGTVYATDKALKYTVRNYLKKAFPGEKVFYLKTLNTELQPRTLDESYEHYFGVYPKEKDAQLRRTVAKHLFECIDVRLFGGTYAGKTSLSIHGPLQITHGVNRFVEGVIYFEQIMTPFRNPGATSAESTMSSLGTQSKLKEGHYVHGFSLNPHNSSDLIELCGGKAISDEDIDKAKKALTQGATFYDSAAKAGTENELMLWVQLKVGSMLVLPSFVDLIQVGEDRKIDLSSVTEILQKPSVTKHIEKIELHYDPTVSNVIGAPSEAVFLELNP